MTKRELIINNAKTQLGVTENPKNSNQQQYGKWYKMDGVAWCAIFVSWVYFISGIALPQIDSAKGFHYCPSAVNYFRRNKKTTKEPAPGDIVFFDWQGDKLSDHVGIFVRWLDEAKTKFESIEGNTSLKNNSNGGEVMLRTRNKESVIEFVNCLD